MSDIGLFKGMAPALPANCLVNIDIRNHSETELNRTVKTLKTSPVTIIATSVESQEQLNMCVRGGVDLFVGNFFTKPSAIKHKSISPSQALLLELSAQTTQDGDIRVIEGIFKKNPDLAFGLMNLVHSAYYRVSEHVASIRQAIALLGYENLHKWVALMLFTIERSDPAANPLFEKALVRARTMELAASKLRSKGLGSSAYISGIFSLVPALFDVPIEEVLTKANFVDEIRRALLERSGIVGGLLTAVEELEKGHHDTFQPRQDLGLQQVDLCRVYTEAIMEYSIPKDQARGNADVISADPCTHGDDVAERSRIAATDGGDWQRRPSWIWRLLSLLGFRMDRGSPT